MKAINLLLCVCYFSCSNGQGIISNEQNQQNKNPSINEDYKKIKQKNSCLKNGS